MTPRAVRIRAWLKAHRGGLGAVALLLIVVGGAMAWNLQGYPALLNDDEGTYADQAMNWIQTGNLSHYTYWYDHPPFGWMVIGAYGWLTGGFTSAASVVMVGRQVMWLATLVSVVLLYILARRLKFRRVFAIAAGLIFGLSPLSIYMHRMVFLDNLAIMFVLAALVFAVSPRRSIAAALGCGLSLAAATLTKETSAIFLPVIVWALWQHTSTQTRKWNLAIFGTIYASISAAYFLYAGLKGELLPGEGHVSLGWSLWYQFFGREGSGSVFDAGSDTHRLVYEWLALDAVLLVGGMLAMVAGFVIRRLRPFALALLILVAVVFKGGYLPNPYVIAIIPFAALLIAGLADETWRNKSRLSRGAVISTAVAAIVLVLPVWANQLVRHSNDQGNANSMEAVAWIQQHTAPSDVVVVDDYAWGDLKRAGYNPLWYWKVNGDPQVAREVIPNGWHSISYIALSYQPPSTLRTLPILADAMKNSQEVAVFGVGEHAVKIYKVNKTS
jgi:4-amino-4-deoxy-L-arabinose transferase-like glycosyltransferase